MITFNDTHHVEKPIPSYRVRKEAMDAAVFELGPHARNGFEYTTVKCDGRWVWKPTDEVRPLSAAQIKAEGGKRCLVKPMEGTAMANPTDPAIAPTCNGLDIAPVPLSPAAEQLGRMGFTDVAQNLSDGLAIPAFLKRDTPEAKEQAKKAMKRIAKQVGPDRPIKNPPDAKEASKPNPTALVHGTDTSKWGKDRAERRARRKAKGATSTTQVYDSPKRAKRTGEALPKLAGHCGAFPSKAALIKTSIAEGHEDEAIVQAVREAFPGCEYKASDIKWYRRKMERSIAGA